MIRHYMCFAVFYFLYDTYAMYVVFRESNEAKAELANGQSSGSAGGRSDVELFVRFLKARPLMVAHHMVLPLILFPIFMAYETGLGDCLLVSIL
jgi:hypothetical protein